ncbi:MAG: OmpA family protein [Microscillaceae bacterium]|nr:OmpA family protein [Microscillaceae bacterium]MDW8461336.1 OmpA family protein [Cytophagales bacterium]
MKKLKQLFTLLGICLFFNIQAQNQYSPWAFSFNYSLIDFAGVNGQQAFQTKNWNRGAQAFATRYITSGVNAFGAVALSTLDYPRDFFNQSTFGLFDLNLGVQYSFANGYILKEDFKIEPYIYAGAGWNRIEDKDPFNWNIGAGLTYWIDRNIGINLQTSYNAIPTYKAYPKYLHHGIGLKFRLGLGKDSDGDGIADDEDECPDVKGIEAFKGCPDSDADGIKDSEDKCPNEAGLPKFDGCPDTDGDNIIDKEDVCPSEPGLAETKGCPDADGDGIADKDDKCPTVKGLLALQGCPDSDGDGIADNQDDCPNQAGLAQFKGCPDSDGDSVPDNRDKCPNVKGIVANDGCPAIEKEKIQEVEKKLAMSAKQINFETNSDVITRASYPELDAIVALMKEYPLAKFRIEGHTDNQGNPTFNKDLSQRRANAVKKYFVDKGIDASRISAQGFGQDRPIETNATPAGRAANRRVEIHVDE